MLGLLAGHHARVPQHELIVTHPIYQPHSSSSQTADRLVPTHPNARHRTRPKASTDSLIDRPSAMAPWRKPGGGAGASIPPPALALPPSPSAPPAAGAIEGEGEGAAHSGQTGLLASGRDAAASSAPEVRYVMCVWIERVCLAVNPPICSNYRSTLEALC